jgi:hypothetical protein
MSDAEHSPAPLMEAAPAEPRLAPDDVGPVTAVDLLIDEARASLTQEIERIKALATAGAVTGRNVTIMGVAAVLVALVAIMALAIGAMFAIAAQMGFGAATAIVVGTLVLIGAVLILMMRRQIGRFRSAARGDQP